MSAKNPVGEKATAVVADDWKETLKRVGGSGQPRLSSKAWGDALVSEVSEKAGLEIGSRGGQ